MAEEEQERDNEKPTDAGRSLSWEAINSLLAADGAAPARGEWILKS